MVPARSIEAWRDQLGKRYAHWKTGHSARALAQCWVRADGMPSEVARVLRPLGKIDLLWATPEYGVGLDTPRASSQCDLLVLGRTPDGLVVIAVEGKVREGFAQAVDKWMGTVKGGPSRLKVCCSAIGLNLDQVASLKYQLVHRTAAAVLQARLMRARTAVMLVHSFDDSNAGYSDFEKLVLAYQGKPERNKLIKVRPSGDGTNLHLAWVTGDKNWLI